MTTSAATRRWVLALSAAASFMVVLDMLVVATALSTIQRDLGASLADLEWTVNAYLLSFAVLLMTGAALGDRYGRRRVFAAGLAVFAVASAACALAPSVGALVAARVAQGAGAAAVMPLALALLGGAYPPERRGWAMGVFGSVTGLAAVLGPLLGGAVTEGLAWQWIFWLNVPVGLVAVPLVCARVPESRGAAAPADLAGLALAGAAAFGVVWGLVRGNAAGWGSAGTLGALGGGLAAGAAFVAWQRRAPAPMLPLRLFASRSFAAGTAAILFLNATLTGTIFLVAQLLQVGLGGGPFAAGLRLLPIGVAPLLLGPVAGALTDRFGERRLVVAGASAQTVAMFWLAAVVRPDVPYARLVGPLTLAGVAITLAVPAVTRAVVGRVAPVDLGRASGTFSTVRQLGGALGVAVLGAAFAAAGGYAAGVPGYPPALAVGGVLALAGVVAALALPVSAAAPAPRAPRAAAPA